MIIVTDSGADLSYDQCQALGVEMVPLKERLDDIPLLADYFVKRYASTMKKRITQVDKRVIEAFMNYSWPGNVRELQNAIERMINFLKTPELTVDLVPDHIRRPTHVVEHREDAEAPQEAERMMILRMLGAKMRKNRIAEKMNISRATLYRKMKQYNLK